MKVLLRLWVNNYKQDQINTQLVNMIAGVVTIRSLSPDQ